MSCINIPYGKSGNEIRIAVELPEGYTNKVVQLRKNPCIEFCYSTDEGVIYDETTSEIVIPRDVTTKLCGTYGYGVLGDDIDSDTDLIYEGRVYIEEAWAKK